MQEAARKLGKMMEYPNLSKPTQVYEQMGLPEYISPIMKLL